MVRAVLTQSKEESMKAGFEKYPTTIFARSGWRQTLAVVAAVGVPLFSGAALAQTAAAAPSAMEQAVIKVLKAHPELVRDALTELERRETVAKAKQEASSLAKSAKAIYADTGAVVLGNPNGDITLVEFMDYHCGYCKKMSTGIDALIQRDPQLRVLVKQLPILGAESIAAAQLMLSVGQGETAQKVHQSLMISPSLDAASLRAIEQSYQLKPTDKVAANRALGEVRVLAEQLNIQGTPALVIGTTVFRGAVEPAQLEAAIKTARLALQNPAKAKS
jgi:protein-disulfide isomerase